MTIRCEIASQDRMIFEGDVDIVVIPGIDGEMGILPNHAPLLALMKMGVVKVRVAGQEEYFTVTGGLAEIQPDIITILAEASENVEEIDIARAEAARERAKQLLESGPAAQEVANLDAIQASLRRSNLRLAAARRYRSGRSRIPQPEIKESGE